MNTEYAKHIMMLMQDCDEYFFNNGFLVFKFFEKVEEYKSSNFTHSFKSENGVTLINLKIENFELLDSNNNFEFFIFIKTIGEIETIKNMKGENFQIVVKTRFANICQNEVNNIQFKLNLIGIESSVQYINGKLLYNLKVTNRNLVKLLEIK